jgi:hypothetical protein
VSTGSFSWSRIAQEKGPERVGASSASRGTSALRSRLSYYRLCGPPLSNDDIIKEYKVDTDTYIEVSKDELENIALESTRTIDIDEFVPKASIDPRYLIRPYYLFSAGRKSRPRRFCGDPRDHSQHGYGCDRPRPR